MLPVDPDMVVNNLTIKIGDKEIEAKVMEKEKAQEKYDDAVSSGKAAVMAQYSKKADDIMQLNIGNVLPG